MSAVEHRNLTRTLLHRSPLPPLANDDDKEARGRVLVIGGSLLVPGAILLAGTAALRAGAGKLQMATIRSAALSLGLAVPESLVFALPQTRTGNIAGKRAASKLSPYAAAANAVLVGPGMASGRSVHQLIAALVAQLRNTATLVLDGAAVIALRQHEQLLKKLSGRAVLTPHAGEIASLTGLEKRHVEKHAAVIAQQVAAKFGATVVLKGAPSWIAEPDGGLFRFAGGSVGLGTSGSGDALAGIVAGLAARGASPTTAALWGVWAHATSGALLARRIGKVGFLARELLVDVPAVLAR
jgi:ADP-dependent NAD(P)H-hydrate dehydratase